jgi:NADH-quinone oxidoreductase subunit J
MMVNVREGMPPEKKKWTLYLSLGLAVVLAIELIFAFKGAFSLTGASMEKSGPAELGRVLFTEYLYPFEITSILIIAALVGAIVLIKREKEE